MSDAREACEAEAFARRRRVAAFAYGTGMPPVRSAGRSIGAGVVVALLLVLGTAALAAVGLR
ncbi:hypothetical protein E8D34_01325 [Nocardioides sp. GY 10113]|uniref:hypothetical protein n=1 Tax=Nocardioides sp. GY 10113 TaxID=2569761 RepID=UPI0010A89B5D|nr:hypothetical protein [Nocardioides sp. GY 10113]TIC89169.1 hypothetical protein E8D34_01325 [Nocardioides sp. GY 10113]